jgi:hypothetical protein
LSSDLNTPEAQKAAKELSKARMESQKVASFLGLLRLPPSGNSPLEKHGPSMLDTLKPTYSKLAEVRRLIAWAKERFPDVELTAEDAPAPEGEAAD